MNKYYIPEISLRDIRNKNNIFDKLDKLYNKNTYTNNMLLSVNGLYKYDKNKLFKYKIIEKDTYIRSNFLNKYTLLGINTYHKNLMDFSLLHLKQNIYQLLLLNIILDRASILVLKSIKIESLIFTFIKQTIARKKSIFR